MADISLIFPRELNPAATVSASEAIPIDNGVTVQKATPTQIVDAGRPFATQAQAETGTDATVAMSPLTTKQAIEAVVPAVVTPFVELAEAWAESATPPDPGVPDSKSSKTWAEEAREAAQDAVNNSPRTYDTVADMESDDRAWPVGTVLSVRGVANYITIPSDGDIINAGGSNISLHDNAFMSVRALGVPNSARIQRLLDIGGDILLDAGVTVTLDTGITIDPVRSAIVGAPRATLDFSSAPSGIDAISIKIGSSLPAFRNAPPLSNVTLVDSAKNKNAIRYGGGGSNSHSIKLDRVTMSGFSSHHIFDDNSFLIKWDRCIHYDWSGTSISYKPGVSNSGENMTFYHCAWHDPDQSALIFDIDFGMTYFVNCSFDYMPAIGDISGPAQPFISFVGGHIEYAFPHSGVSQSSRPMIRQYSGQLLIDGASIYVGQGTPEPLLKTYPGAQAVGQAAIRNIHYHQLTSYDPLTCANYLVDTSDTTQQRAQISGTLMALTIPSGVDERQVFPTSDTGIMPQSASSWGRTGGTITDFTDPTYGKCFNISITSGVASIESPMIPVRGSDWLVGEYWYRLNTLPDGSQPSYLLMRLRTYDAAGNLVGTVPISGASVQVFSSGAGGGWIRVVPIHKNITNQPVGYIAGIRFRAEVYNSSISESASADIQIPRIQFI